MPSNTDWTLSIKNGLRAHFLQPNGPSRPGTDWAVHLSRGVEQQTVFVRAYADDLAGAGPAQEPQLILGFMTRLLESGWTPASYTGTAGELVYVRSIAAPQTQSPEKPKAWWRFW